MNSRFSLVALLGTVLIAVGIGVISYNAGVVHGQSIGAPAAGAQTAVGTPFFWFRPWGFGFFGPLFFVVFWMFLFRILFWGGYHRRRWYYNGFYDDAPRGFEEWHRRAHERMNTKPPSQA